MSFDEATPLYDVIVVGYGPVGQVLTNLLAQDGHRVAVIERWPELYPRPRAAHFDHEIRRLLDRLGVVAELGEDVVGMRSYEWRGADGELILDLEADMLAASGYVFSHLFYQPALERALHERALRAPSVDLLRGWEMVSVAETDGIVTAIGERTRPAGAGELELTGERIELRGRFVVGADGANSRLRTLSGIGEVDLGFSEHWLVVDVGFPDHDVAERLWAQLGDSCQWCDPRRPHMSVQVGRYHRRWEFMLLPGEDPAEFAADDVVWRMLERWVGPADAVLERHVVYRFSSSLAERMRVGRTLLIGDAAHVMPPFMGQGLCSGLRDAANLAWKLDLVLRGISDEALLDTLTAERYEQNRRTIEVSMRMGRVSCTLDPAAARNRDEAFRTGRTPPPEPMPGLRGGIRRRPAGTGSDPLAGSLAVQGLVGRDGRRGLADAVVGDGFCLITRHGVDLAEDDLRTVNALGIRLLCLDPAQPDGCTDLDGRLTGWLSETGVEAVLVRPDFYVFGCAPTTADVPALLADLRDQLLTGKNAPVATRVEAR
ncbi:bifunctional 3-(3-hydroxy-phenyl)propionate/3-hydroxycinnamic acid hydroxylase [Amycolatopsis sp. NPDC006125]|uniref:bifunctional 3-(3-hydroxy-phenyl)propionate/3-hydroxycinnamic acid hydroxylase MhpA n=1 Tax=Amycolatopsis sp. NPDC006125 TaxID=3156730 RepID=UPI0033B023DA